MEVVHRFSEFAREECALSGEKIPIAEILNKEITVLSYRLIKSKAVKEKQCLQLQIEYCGNVRVTFTNSMVLIRQSKDYETEMPFKATIIKNGSYYTFS